MKSVSAGIFTLLLLIFNAHAQSTSVSSADIEVLEGEKWIGNLTYLDYGSGKRTRISSNLIVSRKVGSPNVWLFAFEYPDEPKANDTAEVALAEDGRTINGESVVETRRTTNNALLLVVTTKPGTDNGHKAMLRYSYLIGKRSFAIKKEVQVEGTTDWFTRNEFSWSR